VLNNATPTRSMTHQLPEKALEGLRIEHLAHAADEFPGAQVDCAEAGNRLARRCMQENRVLDLRRHPHATSRTVLLEVALIQAPQINVDPSGQTAEFFYRRDLQRISLGDLGAGPAKPKAHAPEYPLALPYPQIYSVTSVQVFRENRSIPERGS
jgi:hypothetical protein